MTDEPINNTSPVDADTDTRRFLKHVGFMPGEIEAIVGSEGLTGPNLMVIAITRLADRVGAMEAYLRAKIASDRSGRIVKPYSN